MMTLCDIEFSAAEAGLVREVKLEPPPWATESWARSDGRPIKNQTNAAIDAPAASTVSEWRASFETAIAITKIKMRAAQVMRVCYRRDTGFAMSALRAYIWPMPRKPIELPPAVARNFLR
jgi:hypothetical protein